MNPGHWIGIEKKQRPIPPQPRKVGELQGAELGPRSGKNYSGSIQPGGPDLDPQSTVTINQGNDSRTLKVKTETGLQLQQASEASHQGGSGSLSVMALFKNEADILWEWARHYLHQGASQLILINNNSSDDWRGALGPLGFDPSIVCLNDPRLHSQERIYNDVRRSGLIHGNWLLTCDLDEFVYAREPFHTISAYLDQLEDDVTSVAIPWKVFGSSGHGRHPDGRTIDNFLLRKHAEGRVLIKTISRMNALDHLWVHHSRLTWGRGIRSDGSDSQQTSGGWLDCSEDQLARETLHLNHYAVRSREFFERVKAIRGNAYSQSHETDRDIEKGYFERFDHNDTHDPELSRLSKSWAPRPPMPSWFSPERPAPAPGRRAPLFQLLPTAPCLHPKRKQPTTAIQGQWTAQAPKACQHRLGIHIGRVPPHLEDVTLLLPALASALSFPLDRSLPLVFHSEQTTLRRSRKAIEQWLALLQNRHPQLWAKQTTADVHTLEISHTRSCDSWHALAQRLAGNATIQRESNNRRQPQPIVLVSCRARTPQHRRLNQLLKRASQQLNLPRVPLWKLQPLEQLKLFCSYRWVVGPYQPALQLIHALGGVPGHRARVVLLSPSQQSKALMASMELVEAIPHRLLLLPQPGGARLGVLLDALHWMGQPQSDAG